MSICAIFHNILRAETNVNKIWPCPKEDKKWINKYTCSYALSVNVLVWKKQKIYELKENNSIVNYLGKWTIYI